MIDANQEDDGDPSGEIVESIEERIARHPLFELLGNKSRLRIVIALLDAPVPMNPESIADSAGISRQTWYAVSDPLIEYGVVEQVGAAGNSPLYALAEDDELVAAIRKVTDLTGARRREMDAPE